MKKNKLTPKQQANKLAKEAKKKQAAVKVIKQIVETYKEFYNIISKEKKNIPMRGVSTKALCTLLGTKVKQKAKECNHCHTKTHNDKTLCENCSKIPVCKGCGIMLGYWNETKTELIYNNYNKPSLLDPKLCEGCYTVKYSHD